MDITAIISILPTVVACGVCTIALRDALRIRADITKPKTRPTKQYLPLDTPLIALFEPLVPQAEALGFKVHEMLSVSHMGQTLQVVELVNADRTVTLSLTVFGQEALVNFETWWEGKKLLVTRWPYGESIEHSDLISHFAHHSLEAAWDYHQKRLQQQTAAWGKPLTITEAMVKSLEDHYHEHFLPLEMGRLDQLTQRWMWMLIIAFVVCLLSAPFFLSFNIWPGFAFMFGGMLLAALATKNYMQAATIPNTKNAVDAA